MSWRMGRIRAAGRPQLQRSSALEFVRRPGPAAVWMRRGRLLAIMGEATEGARVKAAAVGADGLATAGEASDEEHERAWRAGGSGLAELFRRHYQGVVAHVARFTRDLAAAEDLAQQAFVRLLERARAEGARAGLAGGAGSRSADDISPREAGERPRRTHPTDGGAAGRFRALIYTVARNLALNERRRQGRRYVARTSISGLPDEPAGATGDPLDGLVAAEELAAFRTAVAALPDEDRAAFELKEVRGLTYAEAGARLGLHPDAVRRRVGRAYARLRTALPLTEGRS